MSRDDYLHRAEEGTSADRRLRVFAHRGHLHAVVDYLAAETIAGVPEPMLA